MGGFILLLWEGNGMLTLGCRTEAAVALRQRLNETVDQLDQLRKEHTELSVKYDGQAKELTIAKSDRGRPKLRLVLLLILQKIAPYSTSCQQRPVGHTGTAPRIS
jgi:hypothetical protein